MRRNQGDLAAQKKKERAHSTALWERLELLAPSVDDNKGKPGYRSKTLGGRSREELLKDVVHVVRKLTSSSGARTQQLFDEAEYGAGLVVVLLETGQIVHASRGFLELGSSSLNPNPCTLIHNPDTLNSKLELCTRFFAGSLVDQSFHPDDKQA